MRPGHRRLWHLAWAHACTKIVWCADTVIVTGITAYSASQLVLGASYFHNTFKQKAEAVIPDTAGCLPKATTANKNTDLFQATFKCAANCSVATVHASCAALACAHADK